MTRATGKHGRPIKPGDRQLEISVFGFKLVFLPLAGLALLLGILAGPLGLGWANSIGPWLFLVMGLVLLVSGGYLLKALLLKARERHRNAVETVRIQERYWIDNGPSTW